MWVNTGDRPPSSCRLWSLDVARDAVYAKFPQSDWLGSIRQSAEIMEYRTAAAMDFGESVSATFSFSFPSLSPSRHHPHRHHLGLPLSPSLPPPLPPPSRPRNSAVTPCLLRLSDTGRQPRFSCVSHPSSILNCISFRPVVRVLPCGH
jgi:hypothetical protein